MSVYGYETTIEAMIEDPDSASARTIESDVIEFTDPCAGVPLGIDWMENTLAVFNDPECTGARTIKRNVVEFTAVVKVESESSIRRRFQVVTANA